MTISFSDEQAMLLETATDFCRKRSPMQAVRGALDATNVNRELWAEMAGLGWLGINIPESLGGLGLGVDSLVPIVEAMGHHLMGSPYFGSVLAAETLVRDGTEEQKGKWLPALASGSVATLALSEEDGSWLLENVNVAAANNKAGSLTLKGRKCFVTDADIAEFMLVSVMLEGKAVLVLVQRDQLSDSAIRRETVIDQTRRSFQVDFAGVEIPINQVLEAADFGHLEQVAMLLLSAEMSGGLSGVLHLIVDYLTTRKAFGRYIGSYQSLKHPASDILLSLEAVRSHLYHAATKINAGGAESETAVLMTKSIASEAYAFASDRAVQFHGGFGFTFDCDAQLFLRRALWCQHQFGDESYLRQRLEPLLLDRVV
jgi:acyl-CoA dehydrogenase